MNTRRHLMGVLWFLAIYVGLIVVLLVVPAVLIATGLPPGPSQDQIVQAAADFDDRHGGLLGMLRWAAFLLALGVAILGTWKGVLPGTRRPKA